MVELLIKADLAEAFPQEIVKKTQGKVIFLTDNALSLIFCVVFLIEVVASLTSAGHLES